VGCRFSEPPWAASSRTLLYMGIACWANFALDLLCPLYSKSMVVVEKVSSYQVFNYSCTVLKPVQIGPAEGKVCPRSSRWEIKRGLAVG